MPQNSPLFFGKDGSNVKYHKENISKHIRQIMNENLIEIHHTMLDYLCRLRDFSAKWKVDLHKFGVLLFVLALFRGYQGIYLAYSFYGHCIRCSKTTANHSKQICKILSLLRKDLHQTYCSAAGKAMCCDLLSLETPAIFIARINPEI